MLQRLRITNFAIIENIDVSFGEGFTVLTGETGAGKSLVIDSLSLLLGARASSELIRQGEDKATVIGDFIVRSKRLEAELSAMEVPFVENHITVERTISKTKNSIKINDTPATLSDLNRIAPYLADIHVQFDSQKLLNPENYLVTPAIAIGEKMKSAKVSFEVRAKYDEGYKMVVSTSPITEANCRDADVVLDWQVTEVNEFVTITVDISAYRGKSIYIALVHGNCTDQYYIRVKNLKVFGT